MPDKNSRDPVLQGLFDYGEGGTPKEEWREEYKRRVKGPSRPARDQARRIPKV